MNGSRMARGVEQRRAVRPRLFYLLEPDYFFSVLVRVLDVPLEIGPESAKLVLVRETHFPAATAAAASVVLDCLEQSLIPKFLHSLSGWE